MDTTMLFTGVIFGSIGFAYVIYGRKQMRLSTLLAGLGLCIFPYFIENIWLTILIGLGLVLLPFVLKL